MLWVICAPNHHGTLPCQVMGLTQHTQCATHGASKCCLHYPSQPPPLTNFNGTTTAKGWHHTKATAFPLVFVFVRFGLLPLTPRLQCPLPSLMMFTTCARVHSVPHVNSMLALHVCVCMCAVVHVLWWTWGGDNLATPSTRPWPRPTAATPPITPPPRCTTIVPLLYCVLLCSMLQILLASLLLK